MRFIQEYSIIICVSFFIKISKPSRILGIFPNPGDGDLFNKAVVKVLIERGHHVDYISTFEMTNLLENATRIFNLSEILNFDLQSEFYDLDFMKEPIWFNSQKFENQLCNLMGHKKLQQLFRHLKENSKYDLIITEVFGANCFIGLGHFLKLPIVAISNHLKLPWIDDSLGNQKFISIFNFESKLTDMTNFFNRLKNSLTTFSQTYKFYSSTQKQTDIMRKYLDPEIPEITEIAKNVSLILSNSHFSLNFARPAIPAFIEVGGLHIMEDTNNLTPELKSWLDKSSKGVVCFDLGPIITIENLPKKIIFSLLSSFAKIKPVQTLIRVRDMKKLPLELPRNVKALPWIPRISVLAHKNIRALITTGDNSALQEALYFGIPIIGIPISFNHVVNLETLVKKFVAFMVKIEELNEPKMSEALTVVLRIRLFREQAKRLSQAFKDRPLSIKETTIYWIEYIIKNGPKSLQSPTIFLSWYQIEQLDIYLFLFISLLSSLYLIVLISRKLCQHFRNFLKKEE